MGYFLAIDAGGTGTECWLADDDQVLARAHGDGLRLMHNGAREATGRLERMLLEVFTASGVAPSELSRTCIGLAGLASEGVRTWAEVTLRDRVGGELLVTGDEEIALQAAFDRGPGLLVMAGTGSHVVGRCRNGARMTAGGWGPVLGDEGSAEWIGLEAVRSSLRARDRGVPTCLLRELMNFWQVETVSALVARTQGKTRPEFAGVTRVVMGCAAKRDALAVSVLERAGQELAALVSLLLAKMQAGGCVPGDMQRLAYTGEVLSEIAEVRQALCVALHGMHPEVTLDLEPVRPILGALDRARRG